MLLGVENAGNVACIAMALPQFVCRRAAGQWGFRTSGFVVGALLLGQLLLMVRLLRSPRELAPWYNATGTSFM